MASTRYLINPSSTWCGRDAAWDASGTEIDLSASGTFFHEDLVNISITILLLIQVEQLSANGERIDTKYW